MKLPLDVGTLVECIWRDGLFHVARIIERRKVPDSEEYEYYVHYRKRACCFSERWNSHRK